MARQHAEAEKLEVGKWPSILDDPVAFVDRVAILHQNPATNTASDFKRWLLGQWPMINARISQQPFRELDSPKPRGSARSVTISYPNEVSLFEGSAYGREPDACPVVELQYGKSLKVSSDDIGKHLICIWFITDSRVDRNLAAVDIEDHYLDTNPNGGKPIIKDRRFQITTSPQSLFITKQ